MKLFNTILPLAAIATAFVVPDEVLTGQIVAESQKEPQTFLDRIQGSIDDVWSDVEETFQKAKALSSNALDNAFLAGQNAVKVFECQTSMTKFDVQSWLDSSVFNLDDEDIFDHPHNKPPHHRKPPHHSPHHHKPNKTIYQLISSSKYTTKLTELIDEYPDLVQVLNQTTANYTLFAPTDKAFEKIPKGHKKPSKELIKKVLSYHLSPDFYPVGKLLASYTIPTALGEEALGGEAQRLRVAFALFKGLTINFYSKVIAANIFATNGVIHGVDSILLPPPPATTIISLFPGEFSTLLLGLEKTGLFAAIESSPHDGGTIFAPNNAAFQKLGPKANAFLFSKFGEKYLDALLKYHIVANQTLYSDAFYKAKSADESVFENELFEEQDVPKRQIHVDLPTLLSDRSLSIDILRYGWAITILINGFSTVSVQDGVAKDGVIHAVPKVLIPPKLPGGKAEEADGEIDVEDLMERLLPGFQDEL